MMRLSLQYKWKQISQTLPAKQQLLFLNDSIKLYNQSPENYFFIYAIINTIGIISTVYMNNWLAITIIYITIIHFCWQTLKYLIKLKEFMDKWKNH